ncbi:MAG: hypothetical protein PHV82_14425 [Victivallaceae bacterium]|nr:hypothetical protein [Victivallaceae bacterium]
MRLTSRCNCRCRFCDIGRHEHKVKIRHMSTHLMYESCRPLYENLKQLHFAYGECILHPEMYDFCKFMTQNYPQIILGTESNAVAFTERWQQFAADNLMMVHFSLNAVSCDIYLKGVWSPGIDGGEAAFRQARQNAQDYLEFLRQRTRLCFAPSISMVINRDTAPEVREFCKLALSMKARWCSFYFDYTENGLAEPYFHDAAMSEVLLELMKMQRVLKDKLLLNFRLLIPLQEASPAQAKVNAMPEDELRREYDDLLQLAAERSIIGEYRQREWWRKKFRKHSLSILEDLRPFRHEIHLNKQCVCAAPWRALEIFPDGGVRSCCWMKSIYYTRAVSSRQRVNWAKMLNSLAFKYLRNEMLKGNYPECMECCPLNPNSHPVKTDLQYSLSDSNIIISSTNFEATVRS